jgi:aspartate aminotransferase
MQTSVVVNAVSKAYSMTGWRIGYAAGPGHVVKAMENLQSQATSGPCTMSQEAALVALTGNQGCVESMRQQFDSRRKLMVKLVRAIPGLTCPEPDGAFYVFASFAQLMGHTLAGVKINNSLDFAGLLLDKGHVAVVPGLAFGDDECFRLSYATGTERINEGLSRIAKLLQSGK